jgi:rare lipoprotein A
MVCIDTRRGRQTSCASILPQHRKPCAAPPREPPFKRLKDVFAYGLAFVFISIPCAGFAMGPSESEANPVSLPEPARAKPKPPTLAAIDRHRLASVSGPPVRQVGTAADISRRELGNPRDGQPDLRLDRPVNSGSSPREPASPRPTVPRDTMRYPAFSEVRPSSVSPHQKIGAPYEQNGLWYIPAYEPDYVETGTASWYGREFHGRRTANGEIFDMEVPTAAHPTLPIPSLIEVTNLENGRAMVVRVNDRGPFVAGRLIDLSAKAADRLGFKDKGQAQVRVRYVGPAPLEPLVTADTLTVLPKQGSGQRVWAQQRSLPAQQTSRGAQPARVERSSQQAGVTAPGRMLSEAAPVDNSGRRAGPASGGAGAKAERRAVTPDMPLYVQAGVYSSRANATRAKGQLEGLDGLKVLKTETEQGDVLYRLVVGPSSDRAEAESRIQEVQARGIVGARILAIVDS